MSEDEEILHKGTDLSNYLISEGLIDFETYKPNIACNSQIEEAQCSLVFENKIVDRPKHVQSRPSHTYVSSSDHGKLICLLNSKLLLPDDFELIELLLSRTTVCNSTRYLWVFSGGVIASTVSAALYFNKHVSLNFSFALTSVFSLFFAKNCYSYLTEIYENKSFTFYISTFKNLCVNVHKMLRFFKETEILSTGQVTTHNVGAALYIPAKDLKELDTLPSWKTLPDSRRCLADMLLNIIDVLKFACNEAKKITPDWLYIEGYMFQSESVLPSPQTIDNLSKGKGCVSIRDLQLLNDTYLILQSELLRWVGFCLCPSVWNCLSKSTSFIKAKAKILKLLQKTHIQISGISCKLKMQYNIQNMFTMGKKNILQRSAKNHQTEISIIQLELHNVFLLILSMLLHLRSLEDDLESNSCSDRNTEFSNVKDKLNQQLKIVRDDLTSALKMYDRIYLQALSGKKCNAIEFTDVEEDKIENSDLNEPKISPPEVDTSLSDYCNTSSDEVFLAIFSSDELKICEDSWDIGNKPQKPPKALFSELSTTLKPIKEHFKEREKAALERAGLVDIGSESESENINEISETTNNSCCVGSTSLGNTKGYKSSNSKMSCKINEEIESGVRMPSLEGAELNFSHDLKTQFAETEFIKKDSPEISRPTNVISEKSIANLIAMQSKSWGMTEEEYYDDD